MVEGRDPGIARAGTGVVVADVVTNPATLGRGRFRTKVALALCLVVALVVVAARGFLSEDPLSQVRSDAASAVRALDDRDLVGLESSLAAHRGDPDFAYFFTSETTPRALGDALATVAGPDVDTPLTTGVDPDDYDLTLTDLAGTLALATVGTGDRALPTSWTFDFVDAMSTPATLTGALDTRPPGAPTVREHQDEANKQNLLLLLSRGSWSTEFLQAVTTGFWELDHDKGEGAWPGPVIEDAAYAPAPSGRYLTDGILALAAALTANPEASAWAFTDFQPGTVAIDGSELFVGRFTHFLLFEHHYPEVQGDGNGASAVLTALSSAIEETHPRASGATSVAVSVRDEPGPMHDVAVLRVLASDLNDSGGCSWNLGDWLTCAKIVVESVWHFIQRWGHVVLDVLSLATFAPPPFGVIGVAAATTNATWYVLDGDFTTAGLSLAAVVPGLAFVKIAEAGGVAAAWAKAAARADEVAAAAREYKAVGTVEHAMRSLRPGYALESQAQGDLALQLPGSVTEKALDPRCATTCTGTRRVDIYEPKTRLCVEVKWGIGSTNAGHELKEIAKDRLLRENGLCRSIVWAFAPDMEGRVGPHESLREALLSNGIRYVQVASAAS